MLLSVSLSVEPSWLQHQKMEQSVCGDDQTYSREITVSKFAKWCGSHSTQDWASLLSQYYVGILDGSMLDSQIAGRFLIEEFLGTE